MLIRTKTCFGGSRSYFGLMKNTSTIVIIGIKLLQICSNNPYQLEISENAGISWLQKFGGSPEVGAFYGLCVKGKIILAKTSQGKFRSSDEGITWFRINV